MGLIADAVRANWGEWAAGALVAFAMLHLVRKWFFKKKNAACCGKGCSLPPPNPKK